MPATTSTAPPARASSTTALEAANRTHGAEQRSCSLAFCSARTSTPAHLVEQVADRAVAGGRDADTTAGAHELDDHAGPDPGLARAGGTLDRETAAVEAQGEPAGGVEVALAGAGERAAHVALDTWRNCQQKVTGGAVLAGRGGDAVVEHPLRETDDGSPLHTRVDRLRRHHRRGVRSVAALAAHEVEDALGGLDVHHQPRGLLGARVERSRPRSDLVLLGRVEAVPVDE